MPHDDVPEKLRDRIRRGEITSTIRIWQKPYVRVGGSYPMEQGHVIVDSILPIDGVVDLLKVARHGSGRNVYLITFHYVEP